MAQRAEWNPRPAGGGMAWNMGLRPERFGPQPMDRKGSLHRARG